jgi:large repetitive protein
MSQNKQPSAKRSLHYKSSTSHLIALEPRMMFDGAAVETALATLPASDGMTDFANSDRHLSLPPDFADAFGDNRQAAPFLSGIVDQGGNRVTADDQSGQMLASEPDVSVRAEAASNDFIFIDMSVPNIAGLIQEWNGKGTIVLIDQNSDGIDQIRSALAGQTNVTAIHIVSHGDDGVFWLGNTRVDQAAVAGDLASSFAAIGNKLTASGDILLYGCEVGNGAAGQALIDTLAAVTDADIAASLDNTGSTLRGGDWTLETRVGDIEAATLVAQHWEGLLAPTVISVRPDSLVVRNGAGAIVSQGGTNFSGGRSPGQVAGATATWANAGTIGGQVIDLRATVVSVTAGASVQFDRPVAASDNPAFLLVAGTATGLVSAEIRWETFIAGTNTLIAGDITYSIADIDGVGGNPNSRERIRVDTNTLSSYTLDGTTDIQVTNTPGLVTASGTQDEVANPPLPRSAIRLNWIATSSFTITYDLFTAGATQAGFSHDGDNDFAFTATATQVSIPRLDLDANDSTAAGSAATRTFIENGSAVTIGDADVNITNPIGSVQRATITLTNAQTGDLLSVGALPAGITAVVNTATAGQVIVTLSGAGTAAQYQAALGAITFRNTTERPATVDRNVTVSFTNGTLVSNQATSTIRVIEVNDPPVATNDTTLVTNEDTAGTTVNVLANDVDLDGDTLTVTAATAVNGTVVRNANGTLTYTPNANFNGTDTITYTISDGRGGTSTAMVAVIVNAVNDAPTRVGVIGPQANVDAASAINVATAQAFTDIDNATLTYSAAGLPAGLSINMATGVITGTISRSASQVNGGVYSVVVTATDAGGLSTTQTFAWTVTNPAPIATDDTLLTVNEDTVGTTVNVLANDRDPDGDPLTIISASATNGTVVINAGGTLTYTPNANFNGSDTITYTISDGEGGTSTATIPVTVVAVNDAPVRVGTLPPQANVDAASSINVATAGGFTDVDNATLTYSAAGLPAGLSINATTGVITGTIDRSASQVNSGNYSVTVTARDAAGLSATQTFVWTVTNPVPIAANDITTTNEDTPVTINVLANDRDPDGDPLTVTTASAVNGSVVINPDGTLRYTPNANFNGTDTITYTISDGQGGTSTARVTVTINAINDAPTAVGALPPQTNIDAASGINVATAAAFTDVDNATLTYSAAGLPAGLSIDATTGVITGTIDRSASQVNGGVYNVVVTATDAGGLTATQRFSWTVTNPAPIATNDTASTSEDTPVIINVLGNDRDPDGDPISVVAASAANGSVVINAGGTITYTPNPNFNGTDTITYRISDGQGGFADATVTVTIAAVNDAPTARPLDPQSNLDAEVVAVSVANRFADGDGDALSFSATGLPAGLSIDPATGMISGTIDRSASQMNGGVYNVSVTASDGRGGIVTQSFAWMVTNPAPIATNDSASTNEDTPVIINVLGNDRDPDGDPLTVTSAQAGNGSVIINADGTLTYTPNAGFNGADTITYEISDGQGGTAVATVRITINDVNDTPVSSAIANQTNLDSQNVTLPVAGAFSDPDGDALTYGATGLPPGLSINATTGIISGTIDNSASQTNGGVYSITVTASDGRGGTTSTTFSWTITNPTPTATNDIATTNEDTAQRIDVLANDVDPDRDPLIVTSAVAGRGTVVINPDGSLQYTPEADFNGTDTIIYEITDSEGGISTATVTVTVTAVNDAPTTVGLPNQNDADSATISVPVAGAFADVDGDALSFVATGLPPGLSINPATGLIAGTLTPDASQFGPYNVTVFATDPSGQTVSTNFIWSIQNVPPLANDDVAMTTEDTAVTVAVLANDNDPDRDPISITTAVATNGTVVINGNNTLTYTPDPDFNGTATVTYTITDGNGGFSTATLTVTVGAVNDAPMSDPLPDLANLDNQAVSVDVSSFFDDLDGDTLTFAATGLPAGLSISANGVITGTIDRNASQPNGGVYTVTVTGRDAGGLITSETFTWTVTNPAPTAVNDSATTNEDTPVIVAVLPNDTDPDGDPLTITSATASNGTVTINANGTITYTPNANFNGSDTIIYTISDGNGGSSTAVVNVTIIPVNDAPVAVNDISSTNEDTPVTINVLGNDSDVDGDPLTVTEATSPNGTVVINPDGTITFTPAPNFNGPTTITYTISDGMGGTSTATVNIIVDAVNDPPVAVNDTATTSEDTPVIVPVLANDTDVDGNTLTVVSATAPNGTVVINPDGTITYTPNANFNGTDTVTYMISDGMGGFSTATVMIVVGAVNDAPTTTGIAAQNNPDAATIALPTAGSFADLDGDTLSYAVSGLPAGLSIDPVTGIISGIIDRAASQVNGGVYSVTVTASDGNGSSVSTTFSWTVTNPAPTATNDSATTPEDTPVIVAVLANDNDPDGDPLTVISASAPNGTVVINADGTITYTPNANFNGTDTVTYTISDGNGGTSTATVTITVSPTNDAPTVSALPNASGVDGTLASIPTAGNFSDLDGDTLSFAATGLPAGLSIDPVTGLISGTVDNGASQINGGIYAITVTASDGNGGMVSSTFTYTVTNPAPMAADDSATTNEDTPVIISVLANDNDPDGDALSVTSATAPNGTVVINADGSITYTPNANFNGTDTVTYTISDGNGGTSTATVTITVAPQNDAPTADAPLPAQSNSDADAVSVPTAGNFSDLDGDTLSFSASGLPAGLTIDPATGVISGTIDRSASQIGGGVYSVTVTASDGNGGMVSSTFTWMVANPAPIAANDTASTTEDTPVIISVLVNDTDPDGDPLTVISATAPNGTVVINPDGTITYTPNANFNGSDTITYTISDGQGGTSVATVIVSVAAANDAPQIDAPLGNQSNADADPVSVPTAANFSDLDGDTLTFSAVGLPAGLMIDPATGVISGTIDNSASTVAGGIYTVSVTASDGNGGTATSTFTWTVTNPAPTAINDIASTAEDTPVIIAVLGNDVDPDGDMLTVTQANAANGVVVINPDGTITYTPNANFNGTDTITYTISDGEGGVSVATVTVTVMPVNDAPTTIGLPDLFDSNLEFASVALALSFADVDGDALSYNVIGLPDGLVLDPATGLISGQISATASASGPGGNGIYPVTVTVSDGMGGMVSTTFTWTINNTPPLAVDDVFITNEDTPITLGVLANDVDPDGDATTPTMVVSAFATNGTATINDDGSINFRPDPNFNGIATVTYTISDGLGGFSTAVATITINPVNDAPDAPPLADRPGIDGQPVSIPLGALYSDLDGDTLTFSASGLPLGLSIDPASGLISGTIDNSASQINGGVYVVTITATDGAIPIDRTFVYTISNPAPTAADDVASTGEDTPVVIAVLGNDSDPDGDMLTVTAAAAPNGTVVINADGTITYTPDADFNGTDTITYTISDGEGGTSTATVTVTVTAGNDAPVAAPLAPRVNQDADSISIATAANFSDVDGDTLTFSAAGLPTGLMIDPATGVISGMIDRSASQVNGGIYNVTVTARDGNGGMVSTSFAWTISNPAPVANDDSATTSEDTPVNIAVLPNDSDPDGDMISVTLASAPNGTVVINADGTLTYTPNANFNGIDTITYTISDGQGGTSTALVTISVGAQNDMPTATPLPPRANVDSAMINIPVAANFADLDGDTLSFSAAELPGGLIIDPATGVISGTIAPGASQVSGGVYNVTVTASDGNGGMVSTSFVWTITNPAPIAVNDSAVTAEDFPVTIAVLANDSDPDGDTLSITTASAANGSVTINADGTISYTPNANFNGNDTITYTISDGNGGTSTAAVTVTVNAGNDAPIARSDNATTAEDTPVIVPALANDSDIDGDPLTVTSATAPNGTVVINADGTITYSPNANFNGTDTVTYTISDGNGGTSTATVTVIVAPRNDPPVAVNDSAATAEDTPVNIAPFANDSDVDGDPLTITSASSPDGQVTINADGTIRFVPNPNFNGMTTVTYTISDGNGGTSTATVSLTVTPVNDVPVAQPDSATTPEDTPVIVAVLPNDSDVDGNPLTVVSAIAPNGTVVINRDGTITYTPNANFNGSDTITYTISDAAGGFATTTVAVIVTPVNDVPVAGNDSATTTEDAPVTIPVLANDSDADGNPLTITSALSPNGTLVINPDGTISFTPAANFTGPATITYTVSDGNGGTATATVTVNVTPVNDAPVAVNDSAVTSEDMQLTISVLGNDSDVDGDMLSVVNAVAGNGSVVINPDGTITYTPNANFNGTDTVTYTISDGNGGFSTATVTVTVAPVNDPPVANPDQVTTDEESPVTIPVLANDRDADGDPLTVTAASAPNGVVTVNPDGSLRYVPNANFFGTDTISYTVSDGRGGLTTTTVTVVVRPVDDAPVARPDAATTNEDMPVSLNVLTNDSDPDGNPLTVVSATAPNGTIIIGPDGRITYTPNANFNGTDTITYRVSDGVGGFATSTVTVTVIPVNDAPVDGDEMVTAIGGSTTRISVLANASDVDGNPLIVTSAVASIGVVAINPDGTISFTAPPEFDGIATITYVVSDGMGGFNTSTVTINVAQASADINALLGRADPFGEDGGRIDRKVDPYAGLVTTPLIILDTVNGFASLNGTPDLNVRMPILEAVNGLRTLKGTGTLDVNGQPVGQVVEWVDRVRDLRFGAEKLFDPRFGDFIAQSLTGFSVRELTAANGQIMIESVVRDRVVYMEVRDIGKDGDPRITEYQLRMRDGSALPEWIKMDARGLAIIERPVDAEEIRLIVRAIRADGQVIEVPVLVQGATGEIQLDEKAGKTSDRVSQLLPFGAAVAQAEAEASTESARIANAFAA